MIFVSKVINVVEIIDDVLALGKYLCEFKVCLQDRLCEWGQTQDKIAISCEIRMTVKRIQIQIEKPDSRVG